MYNCTVAIPGYNLLVQTNSKSMINRLTQIVTHEDVHDDVINESIHIKFIAQCDVSSLVNFCSSGNTVKNIEYVANVENYESDNARTIVRRNARNNVIIAVITKDFKTGHFFAYLKSRHSIAKAFCLNRLEVHIANLLIRKNYYPLHAAGLVLDNVGICIVGESGAGKSTTALQLIAQGAKLISNDFLCVDYRNTLTAYSLDRTIAVRKNLSTKCKPTWDYWKSIISEKNAFSKENSEQTYFLADELFPQQFIKSHTIQFITFIFITNEVKEVTVKSLNKVEAFKLFMKNRIVAAPQYREGKLSMDIFNELYSKCIFTTLLVPKWEREVETVVSKEELLFLLFSCGKVEVSNN